MFSNPVLPNCSSSVSSSEGISSGEGLSSGEGISIYSLEVSSTCSILGNVSSLSISSNEISSG